MNINIVNNWVTCTPDSHPAAVCRDDEIDLWTPCGMVIVGFYSAWSGCIWQTIVLFAISILWPSMVGWPFAGGNCKIAYVALYHMAL